MHTYNVKVPCTYDVETGKVTSTPFGVNVKASCPAEAVDLVTGPGEAPWQTSLQTLELAPGMWKVTDIFLEMTVKVYQVQ